MPIADLLSLLDAAVVLFSLTIPLLMYFTSLPRGTDGMVITLQCRHTHDLYPGALKHSVANTQINNTNLLSTSTALLIFNLYPQSVVFF